MGCYAAIMAEALRNLLDEVAVGQLGFHLARVLPGLDRHAFETEACAGLRALELKARVQHLSAVLERHLQRVLADDFAAACDALAAALQQAPGPVVLVSNEIGLGLAPLSREARHFVDALGRLHQQVAAVCARVTLMVAGLEMAVRR